MLSLHKSTQTVLITLVAALIAVIIGSLLHFLLGSLATSTAGYAVTFTLASLCSSTVIIFTMRKTGKGAEQFAHQVGDQIDQIMIGAAETSYFVDSVKKKIEADIQAASEIVGSSDQNVKTTKQMASNAKRALMVAHEARRETIAARAEVDQGLMHISSARDEAQTASTLMKELQEKSRRIHGITEVINEIAARTNLLALNAAIEAARAGEHGRGFAVVAGEVRQLAQRTKTATDEIGLMVKEITGQSEKAAGGMQHLTDKVMEAAQNVERVHTFLAAVETSSSSSENEIQKIADASREHVETANTISQTIAQIRDSMLSTEAALPRATDSAMALAERAESIAGAMAEANVPTAHDEVRMAAQKTAAEVGRLFSEAIANGQITREALFDRRYTPIPNTNPQKHTTRFDSFTDRVLPPLQESLLAAMPQLAFAGAVDNNGYFPTHNKKFSQRLTGKYDVDIINNRTKRIFNDRTGSRCGSNTKEFLLQTYKRDTGEVMHDLSAPIYVDGKHWGGFRIGYRSSAPVSKPTTQPVAAATPVALPNKSAPGLGLNNRPAYG